MWQSHVSKYEAGSLSLDSRSTMWIIYDFHAHKEPEVVVKYLDI